MTPDTPIGTADTRLIARVFQHPLTHNLAWRAVLALFRSIGTLEQGAGGHAILHLNGQHHAFRPGNHKTLEPADVLALRDLLTRAGWDGGAPTPTAPSKSDLVVVIDHAEARIYAATPDDGAVPQVLHHLRHDSDPARRDADRDETWPDDARFFAGIAAALKGGGRIVVVGHGKGQSNEAVHLMVWLARHDSTVHARVAGEVTADLSHQTLRQLLSRARLALAPGPMTVGQA